MNPVTFELASSDGSSRKSPAKHSVNPVLLSESEHSSTTDLVTNILTCVFSSGLFVFPLFFRTYGVVLGLIVVAVANLLNWWTSRIIYEAFDETQKHTMVEMINQLVGAPAASIAKVTYFFDYFSNYLISLLFSWSIVQYVLYYTGTIGHENVMVSQIISFEHGSSEIIVFRLIFTLLVLLFVTPLLVKEGARLTKWIMLFYFASWIVLLIYTVVDLRSFAEHYEKNGTLQVSTWKPFNTDYFRFSFIVLTSLYIQPSLMTMRSQHNTRDIHDLGVTVRKAYLYLTIVTVLFGLYTYTHLGNNHTDDLFMLRATFPGKRYESVYLTVLMVVAVLNLMYIRFYHSNMESYLHDFVAGSDQSIFWRIAPWFGALLLTFVYPHIIKTLGYMSSTVFLADGYVFPILMKIEMEKAKGASNLKIAGYYASIGVLCLMGVVSLVALFESNDST